ncbi:C-C chemokine receptor type 6a [Trichomycterus rosablanca]|uniref:C-C chemokine receptor type 6a n=1 Tax=Trichomycterus rosablanca TaxID=2290929 RepID=UPI002F357190
MLIIEEVPQRSKDPEYEDDYNFSYTNAAEPCYESQLNSNVSYFVQIYIHTLICIVGFVGNALVILTYAFYKRTKSMTDVYLLNVAIADVLFVVALPLIIYSEQSGWALGSWSCKLLRGLYNINLYSGVLLLACISLDRYIAIVQARRSFRFRSSMLIYSYVICAFVWLLALLISLPTFLYYEAYAPDDSFEAKQSVCFFKFNDTRTAETMKVLVPSSQLAVGFFLPVLVMCVCYTSVICTLLHAKNFQRHKAVRVVLAVVLVFIACHLPYNAVLLYYTIEMKNQMDCRTDDDIKLSLIITESLAYLHCCLNPMLYAFIGVKFRNHFRNIVVDLWCLGKRYIRARRTSRVTSEAYLSSRRSVDSSSKENGTSFTM